MKKRNTHSGRYVLHVCGQILSAVLLVLIMPALLPGARGVSAEEEVSPVNQSNAPEEGGEVTLPPRFDWREHGKAPLVRTQGKLGTCWAISACSALEAVLLPQENLVFSPDHLSLNNGFVITQKEGGDPKMIMAYLSSWRGPVLEEEDPYGDGETTPDLTASVHVQEMHLLDGMSPETIKEEILQYGPVQTSLCMDRSMTAAAKGYYNAASAAFCDPVEEKITHDILILGWDDTFEAGRFAGNVSRDGAWICQNTWGASFGENGIFYVSYEDANIARTGLVYAGVEPADNFDVLYQNDVCGWQGRIGYDSETAWFANCFTAAGEEVLAAAGFYALGPDTDYEVCLVHNAEGTAAFSKRVRVAEGHLEHAGYYTVDAAASEEDVLLEAGERFALLVRITTRDAAKPVAVEMAKDSYTANVTLDSREGYISAEGILWDETESVYGANICLKAYTNTYDDGADQRNES